MNWILRYARQAQKDADTLASAGLKGKALYLLDRIANDPFQHPPPFEKLVGKTGVYSRRINIQHRLVYQVFPDQQTIKILRMWTQHA